MRQSLKPLPLAIFGGVACAFLLSAALAQQGARENQARNDDQARTQNQGETLSLVYPTGDRATSALLVEVTAPDEVQVGRNFNYTVRVTNLTKNLILEDVTVRQETGEGFSIERFEPADGQGEEKANQQQVDQKPGQRDDGQHQAEQPRSGHGNAENAWDVGRLEPGQSRTAQVTALGDQEGLAKNCIKVHYEPALCLTTKFTKPAIQVTKTAPDVADICRPLELRYAVKNTGSGVARAITLNDDLPEGLVTDQKANKVSFDVGDLEPGATKEFKVATHATKTGEFGSRAVASGENDLKARSQQVTTKIVQSKLAVSLEGPSAQFIDQPMTYQATVKNEGDAPAQEARLRIDVDEHARILRMSKSEPEDVRPQQDGHTLAWQFGDLEPGGERTVSFTINTSQQANLKHVAHATSACAAGGDLAKAATDTAEVATELITLPALLLEMVDREDPVKVGEIEHYDIVIKNQGNGPDQNVQVKIDLPDQFEFVDASGSTNAKADGQTVTFEPIPEMAPKAEASWTLQVKAVKSGDVKTKAHLSSDYLTSPATSEEPTRVIE